MLSQYRVVDRSDERGMLCGQILADLGADVVRIEPPGGSRVRSLPPFRGDQPDPEGSLSWWALARNSRSIELDARRDADRAVLLELAATADVWIESEAPGVAAADRLAYEDLAAVNPGLVYVSITPFGQSGPKAGFASTDLIVMAASGALYLTGDADGPPVRTAVPQAYCHASAEAAVAALVALFERARSGRGQHVDVAAQQATTLATMFAILDAPWRARPRGRAATARRVGTHDIRTHYPTRDGWAVIVPGFARPVAPFMDRLMAWVHEEGHVDASRIDEDWARYGVQLVAGEIDPAEYAEVIDGIAALLASKSNAEVLEAALARRLLVAPVLSVGDVLESDQLAERGFLNSLEHPGGEPVRYPGGFARFSETPIAKGTPPPRRNEHASEVRAELRASRPGRQTSEPTLPNSDETNEQTSGADSTRLPLEGVKVLDLFWVLAGPAATRTLADFGATVVHVESSRRRDTLRSVAPHLDGKSGPERSGAFQCANAGKLGVTLDLTSPDARDVLLDLVRWADVITESFAPGVMARLGLGEDVLRSVNPDAIVISSCLMGQTGPMRSFAGYGSLAASVTGFQPLAAWPGGPPSGPFGAYTDYIAVRYNAIAILAALDHRRRTGQGQHIDMSQAEAGLHFLGSAVLDYTVNDRVPEPCGNQDRVMSPHGVYPCIGQDRWVALAVRDERDWRALCEAMGRADWEADPDLRDASVRRARAEEIDQEITAWTGACVAGDIEQTLQERGVPAHAVLDMADLAADPQLAHRGHLIEVEHPEHGRLPIEAARFQLSRTPARRPTQALTYGRDNHYVLSELLGYSAERIAGLEEADVLV